MSDKDLSNPSEPEEDEPDWIKGLRDDGEPLDSESDDSQILDAQDSNLGVQEEPSSSPFQEGNEHLPDLVEGIQSDEASPDSISEETASPDWLSNIRSAEAENAPPEEQPNSSDVSDEDGQDPGWLNQVREREEERTEEEELEDQDQPDYMERIRSVQADEVQGAQDLSDQDSPDWISGLQAESEGDQPPPAEKSSDWMSETIIAPSSEPEASSSPPVESEGDQPPPAEKSSDWMSETIIAPSSESESGSLETISSEEAIDPPGNEKLLSESELSAFREEHTKTKIKIKVEPKPETSEEPEETDIKETGSLPSWLVDIRSTGSLDIGDLPTESAELDPTADDLAEDLQIPEFGLSPGDLPDWITETSSDLEYPEEEVEEIDQVKEDDQADEVAPADEVSPTEEVAPAAEVAPADEGAPAHEGAPADEIAPAEEIEPADVPKWLYGMRPVESPYAEAEGEAVEETVGPLAGLQNLIPAEPEIVQIGKPPAYSYKLDVTDAQRRNASLLEELIVSDPKINTSKTRAAAFTQGALRWAIAGLIFVSMLVPILTDFINIDLPDIGNMPLQTKLFQESVRNLDQGKPILVSFDYQPGMSAEMHAAAAAVFDDLLLQGVPLVIVSTQPTGPGLADWFLDQTQAEKHLYIENKEYRNLGYIAGGIAGLQSLSKDPRKTLPINISVVDQFGTLKSESIWDNPPLIGIENLSDFGMILVLTDDPDIARAWIEQVNPNLNQTPLTMVLSAQAEPLVRPYYDSDPKQVQGYVTGVLGGAYYENSIRRDNVARTYWNSYSIGLGVAVFTIFFGSLASFATSLLSRRKMSKGAF